MTSVRRGSADAPLAGRTPRRDGDTDILTPLGPVAPAVARYLYLRRDLLAEEVRGRMLQRRPLVGRLPISAVHSCLEERLGRPLDHAFGWFEPLPHPGLSSPLISVHQARGPDGGELLVKLRHPDAESRAEQAMVGLTQVLRTLAEAVGDDRICEPSIEAEIRRWVHRDLDLASEQNALKRMQDAQPRNGLLVIPELDPDRCAEGVLTVAALDGVPVADLLARMPATRADELVRLGTGAEDLAWNIDAMMIQQIFTAGLFPADPTPDRLLVLPQGRVSLTAFTQVEVVEPVIRREQLPFVWAVSAGDTERVLSVFLDLAEVTQSRAEEEFVREFRRLAREWEIARITIAPAAEPWLLRAMDDTAAMVRRHGIELPRSMHRAYRALAAAASVSRELSSGIDLATVADGYFKARRLDDLAELATAPRLQRLVLDVFDLLTQGPGNVARLLSDFSGQRFVLRVQNVESDESEHVNNVRARLLATAAVLLALCVLAAALWIAPPTSIAPSVVVGVLIAAAAVVFGVLWRQLK